MTQRLTATLKYHRCVTVTLPDGTSMTLKVLGDKDAANAAAKAFVAAMNGTPAFPAPVMLTGGDACLAEAHAHMGR
jgi:hypothetical protein